MYAICTYEGYRYYLFPYFRYNFNTSCHDTVRMEIWSKYATRTSFDAKMFYLQIFKFNQMIKITFVGLVRFLRHF
jgi:hypothetical protein